MSPLGCSPPQACTHLRYMLMRNRTQVKVLSAGSIRHRNAAFVCCSADYVHFPEAHESHCKK